MCLQFSTILWGCVSCFRSGCCVCSQSTKNDNTLKVQSAVWSCSSEVKRIFCVSRWQWMKHGSATTHLKQKYRQLSGQQVVKTVQSDQKLNSELARLWHPYFETRIVFCSSTILRKVKPLTATITWNHWIGWAQKSSENGLICKKKKCCSTKTVHRATTPRKWLSDVLIIYIPLISIFLGARYTYIWISETSLMKYLGINYSFTIK